MSEQDELERMSDDAFDDMLVRLATHLTPDVGEMLNECCRARAAESAAAERIEIFDALVDDQSKRIAELERDLATLKEAFDFEANERVKAVHRIAELEAENARLARERDAELAYLAMCKAKEGKDA